MMGVRLRPERDLRDRGSARPVSWVSLIDAELRGLGVVAAARALMANGR